MRVFTITSPTLGKITSRSLVLAPHSLHHQQVISGVDVQLWRTARTKTPVYMAMRIKPNPVATRIRVTRILQVFGVHIIPTLMVSSSFF